MSVLDDLNVAVAAVAAHVSSLEADNAVLIATNASLASAASLASLTPGPAPAGFQQIGGVDMTSVPVAEVAPVADVAVVPVTTPPLFVADPAAEETAEDAAFAEAQAAHAIDEAAEAAAVVVVPDTPAPIDPNAPGTQATPTGNAITPGEPAGGASTPLV
jgi:hypothetical protein